jgi:uncharacterized protein (DUF2384 family)
MNAKLKIYKEIESDFQSVNEPMAIYLPASFIKNNVLENIAQNSKELFLRVVDKTGLTIKILAENIFEITPKTFIKYKNNNTKVPSRITEIAIEINTLYDLGIELFGSSTVFNAWLDKENMFFNNKKPAQFLNTSTGIHYVYEELKRLEFGTTA